MSTPPRFGIAAHVVILPLDRMRARVVELEGSRAGWVYTVRYLHAGEAKTMRCFPDELEAFDGNQESPRTI